ncbi:hypothetical protein [Paeniglutamicibacter sp.]|uniref:hypothetical protein n=1 Tax=Paeniglutamicibacter sp. TaxID=1934391 RepID=UPI003989CF89
MSSPESESARVEAGYRKARLSGDQQLIAAAADECVRAYGAIGNAEKQCEFLHILGTCQILAGAYGASLQTTELLFDSPIVQLDPVLKAKTLILRAAALRNQSNHGPAIESARQALATLESVKGSFRIRAEACQSLIASLVEADKIDEAWGLRELLAKTLGEISDAQLAGHGYWTLGNLAFAHGQTSEGMEYHGRAAGFLRLANDIHVWARFNKASADMQLQAGVANEKTHDCIERAELAYGIIGGSASELLGLSVTRARWNVATGELARASEILELATRSTDEGQVLEDASAHVLWAQILADLGRHSEAERERGNAGRIQDSMANLERRDRQGPAV